MDDISPAPDTSSGRARTLSRATGEGERTVTTVLLAAASLATACAVLFATTPNWPQWVGEMQAGSAQVLLALLGLLMWLCLAGLYGAAWFTGAFDRLLRAPRLAQAAAGLAAITLLAWAATGFAHGALVAARDTAAGSAAAAATLPLLALAAAWAAWRQPAPR